MTPIGPLEQVLRVIAVLDDLAIPYALGGSFAASFFGEPRATMDVDIAIVVPAETGERLLNRLGDDYVVPEDTARQALRSADSFNVLPRDGGLKVDLFVLGDTVLDQRQIARRIAVEVPGADRPIWVTSPEDQILRKLDWFRAGDHVSDRQWRDVLGIIGVGGDGLDLTSLRTTAGQVGLSDLVEQALTQALGR